MWGYNPEDYFGEVLSPVASEVQQAIPATQVPYVSIAGSVARNLTDTHDRYLRTIDSLLSRAADLQKNISTMSVGGKELLAPGLRALSGELSNIYHTIPAMLQGEAAIPLSRWDRELKTAMTPYRMAGELSRAQLLGAQTAAIPYEEAMAYPGAYWKGMEGAQVGRLISPEGAEWAKTFWEKASDALQALWSPIPPGNEENRR